MGTRTEKAEVEREIRFCDVCGKTGHFDYGVGGWCIICKKDVCGRCSVPDPDDPGDHPNLFCRSCWDIGKPYREQIGEECDRHEAQCDEIRERWVKAASQAKSST